jgi:hypothetical protein
LREYWKLVRDTCTYLTQGGGKAGNQKVIKKIKGHKFAEISEVMELALLKEYIRQKDLQYSRDLGAFRESLNIIGNRRYLVANKTLFNLLQFQVFMRSRDYEIKKVKRMV